MAKSRKKKSSDEDVALSNVARLHSFSHDMQHCLHVIHLGLQVLKNVRLDDEKFNEVAEMIEHERKAGTKLVTDYMAAELEDKPQVPVD